MDKLTQVANNLGVLPDELRTIIQLESAHNPKAVNPISGAVGLIQFMPATLKGYNLTPSQVLSMTYDQQLDLVERYLKVYRSRIKSLTDLYLAVFYPRAIGRPTSFVIGSEVSRSRAVLIGKQNPVFNKGLPVTIGHVENVLKTKVKRGAVVRWAQRLPLILFPIVVFLFYLFNE